MDNTEGTGKFDLGKDHKPFMKIVRPGSNCGNCKYISLDRKHCNSKLFVQWYGKSKLPEPVEDYCSDWYEPHPVDKVFDKIDDFLGVKQNNKK